MDWTALVAAKQQECAAKIPPAWRLDPALIAALTAPGVNLLAADVPRTSGLLSSLELEITEQYSAQELLQKLAGGVFTSKDVTLAYCKRAAIAQQLTSCLTETMFEAAQQRAQELDDHLARTGKPVGPLHGLPVSVKDSFLVAGVQATVGYVEFLKRPPETTNSPLIELLLSLGAVIYVKTNIPQTMMTGDSHNNIFGRTLNPHNTSLTAGGSSGGEGSLVAFRGSPLGVGTDVAGSIRIPALCCGVYGFKPTVDRVPYGGQVSEGPEGMPGLKPAAGPLASSFEDLEVFMSSVINAEPWRFDVSAMGGSWSEAPSTSTTTLTIGIPAPDEDFPLHPPVRRSLDEAIAKLEAAGHKIVHLPSPPPESSIAHANRLAFEYFIYAPAPDHITPSGEPPVPSVAAKSSPMFTGPLPVPLEGEPDLSETITKLYALRQAYAEFWRKIWVEYSLDIVLAPGAQSTAVEHDTYGWPPYTLVWNLLDYPACLIPFGKSSKELDPEPFTLTDGVQPSYNPELVDGAPCAVQVIAPRFQDERCLQAAKIVDGVLSL
ncbi:hypothetical protein ASPZODRAFT_76028 [Penicilliopsis zonata CBS 506.65]|uniref:amidase n=1 Tax=Penicilliopsis zonata CBS 506.65 TaxID=1073090 RepID=A0A1L9S6M7_9EURO|nr:hypothetical protein ASPZODRAFT_76028 [Penicilliopsis zonata CBS 506.65]OJJ42783.1 hypothetical protein ASPZODRAFT_76028 [Penicilliopsis zonata CBS 506.65]